MEEVAGSLGTGGSLFLRLGQIIFSTVSLFFMCLDIDFYSYTAFWWINEGLEEREFPGDSDGFGSPLERHTGNGGCLLRACKTPAPPSWHRDAHCHRRLGLVSPFTGCSHLSCQRGAVAAFFGGRLPILLCYEDLHRIPPLGFHGSLVLASLARLFSLQPLGSSKIMTNKLPQRN